VHLKVKDKLDKEACELAPNLEDVPEIQKKVVTKLYEYYGG